MTYDEQTNEIVLATGRRFDNLVSVSDGTDYLSYGSDGGFYIDDWTPAERTELADEMIRRWTLFKERA